MTTQNEKDLHEIEISEQNARRKVEKFRALQRLIANPDWQTLIDTGYFFEEANRVVLAKAMPGNAAPEDQENINKQIDAIGWFRQYLLVTLQKGEEMEEALREYDKTREDIITEEAELDEAV